MSAGNAVQQQTLDDWRSILNSGEDSLEIFCIKTEFKSVLGTKVQ